MVFVDDVASADRRTQLEALRDMLAREISNAERGADIAALTLRLMKVLEELNKLPSGEQVSKLDELTERRDKRTGGSAGAARRQGGRRRRSAP